MKCQRCEKQATFHITEIAKPEVIEIHLCEGCARQYLAAQNEEGGGDDDASTMAVEQTKIGQTAEELAQLDQRTCPVCGISFYEFRQQGRLGCPHDYVCFESELEPLLLNIHDGTRHKGKRPRRGLQHTDRQTDLIRLRREMKESVEREDYELARELRDQIRAIENEQRESGPSAEGTS
jgi:protein arginine kinase activator